MQLFQFILGLFELGQLLRELCLDFGGGLFGHQLPRRLDELLHLCEESPHLLLLTLLAPGTIFHLGIT